MKRVLFLYATKSSGHRRAADAIRNQLAALDPSVKTTGMDFFTHHYPHLSPFFFRMYVDLMRSLPHVWDYLYDHPDIAAATKELRAFLNLLNVPKLRTLVRREKPDAIVCTQSVPAGFLAQEKRKNRIAVPLFAVITDFVANPYWPVTHMDGYFVPHDDIRQQLMARGVPAQRIMVTGIPIDASFAAAHDRAAARSRLGIRPSETAVLVMGGNHGLGQIETAVHALADCMAPVHTIVVTGHNRALQRRLMKRYAARRSVTVLGISNAIAELMDAADVLISKPGGLTSSEALAKRLPMIMVAPLPGQEERNAEFLVRHRVALRCTDVKSLGRMVVDLFSRPASLRRMKEQALALGRPHAARVAASHIMNAVKSV